MDHAAMLSRIFGPFFLIIGLWVFFRGDEVKKIWASMRSIPALVFFGGIINLLIGFSILSLHSTWSLQLAVLLTMIGWLQVIRGIVILFAPQRFLDLAVASEKHWSKLLFIPIVVGICLSYVGFFS